MINEIEIILCDCGNINHQILITKHDDLPYRLVSFRPHLTTYKNFFNRVIEGTKYIFGTKANTWDEIVVTKDNYLPLKKIVEYLEYELHNGKKQTDIQGANFG